MPEDQFQTLKQMMENMRASMESRFEQVDKRFEQVDERFKHVDERFTEVGKQLDRVDTILTLKPDHKDIYVAVFGAVFGMFGIIVGAMVVANLFGAFQ